MVFGGIERRQNTTSFGGHRLSVESRDRRRIMTAALEWVGRGAKGRDLLPRALPLVIYEDVRKVEPESHQDGSHRRR